MKNKKIFVNIKAAAAYIVCDSFRFPVKPLSYNECPLYQNQNPTGGLFISALEIPWVILIWI